MEDVVLTFNGDSFKKVLDDIAGKLGLVENKTKDVEGTAKNSFKKSSDILSMVSGRVVALGASFLGVRKIIQGMPEIGRTFDIVGDILSRNLLWPLRQEVMPLLQKLLNWARDHRVQFVQAGNTIANVFRVIKNIIEGVIKLLSNLWEKLSGAIDRVFGKTIRSMSDLVNIAVFKISAVFQFIMIAMEPVIDFIAGAFETMLKAGKSFWEGLSLGLGELGPVFDDIIGQFQRLLGFTDKMGNSTNVLIKAFKVLGFILGTVIRTTLVSIGQTLDLVSQGIDNVINRVSFLKAWKSGNNREMVRLDREMIKSNDEFGARTKKRWSELGSTVVSGVKEINNDFTKISNQTNNSIVNPGSTGGAMTKNPIVKPGSTGGTNITNDVNITILESKTPQATAAAVNEGLRGKLNMSRVRAGAQ